MDWVIVQVVIGLSFLFFLLSIVASAVNEAIAGFFKLRAKTLEKGLTNLLTGSTDSKDLTAIVHKFYDHPLINSSGRDPQRGPSYLSPDAFRVALLDIAGLSEAAAEPARADDPVGARENRERVAAALDAMPDDFLKGSLMAIWRSVGRDTEAFRAGIERWFDQGMDRVSGWYKRRAQIILFVVGFVLAVLLNASAITAADRLWKDEGFRRGLIAQVENQQAETTTKEALGQLETLRFPVGWEESNRPNGVAGWLLAGLGWLLTGIAITFGAPFWFDLLNKVSNLRAAGSKPDTAPPEPGR